MNTHPAHVGASIPAAIAALTHPNSLADECAKLDPTNPHAAEHWDMRVRQMMRLPGGENALRSLLFEAASRRSDRQATSKSFSNAIRHPGAWLNAQTLKWVTAARARAANEREKT